MFGTIRGIGWTLFGIGLVGLSAIGILELRILKGWEPRWLRKFMAGCLVVDIYRDKNDPDGHRRLEIQHPKGWSDWYILDSDEVGLCEIGDTIHLWTIGKHVAHVVKVEAAVGPYPFQSRLVPWGRKNESEQSGCAWTLLVLGPFLGSVLIGKGLEHALSGEVYHSGSNGRRGSYPAWVGTGWDAWIPAYLLLIVGVLVLGSTVLAWLRGWNDGFLDDWSDGNRPWSARSNWWF